MHKGQFDQARQIFLEQSGSFLDLNVPDGRSLVRPSIILFGRICQEQVELRQAESAARQVLVSAREDQDSDDIADSQLDLAAISCAWNELDLAEEQAQEALEKGHKLNHQETIVYATLILVRIKRIRGELLPAIQMLTDLLTRVRPDGVPVHLWLFRAIQTEQARIALATGDLASVERWINARGQSNGDLLPKIQQEQEELLIARWLIATGKLDEALKVLTPLREAALVAGRIRSALEAQIQMALIAATRKQVAEARNLLQEVLMRTAPENYQRLFLDEGKPMALLLQSLLPTVQGELQASFVHHLLQIFARTYNSQSTHTTLPGTLIESIPALINEPLSTQEQRVLRLLVAGRSNPEIANELIVSVNTIKTQLQHIYRKLNVNNRTEARDVARALKLV
jgi:LuxR family maltose regulon positive regulatory protein